MSDPKIHKEYKTIYEITWKQGMPEYYKDNLKPLYDPSNYKILKWKVYIVEGEKCAKLLEQYFVPCLPPIEVYTWCDTEAPEKTDWSILKDREVIIWPDNDKVGRRVANKVAKILLPIAKEVRLIDIDRLNLPEKGDAVDWIKTNPTATAHDFWNLPKLTIVAK